MKYRKKPIIVDAIQWKGDNLREIYYFVGDTCSDSPQGNILINTLEGTMFASQGDWIIKGISGEFYPCKPEIFAATYEEVI
jgi:hypothetical protein